MVAPAINLHYDHVKNPPFRLLKLLQDVFADTVGSLDGHLAMIASLIVAIPGCIKDRIQGYKCTNLLDQLIGIGTDQFDTIGFVKTLISVLDESSTHEYAQLVQSDSKNKVQFFDFRDPQRNAFAYGDFNVPSYDLGAIKAGSISIWQDNSDRLVNQFDTFTLLKDLKCKCEAIRISSDFKLIFSFNDITN